MQGIGHEPGLRRIRNKKGREKDGEGSDQEDHFPRIAENGPDRKSVV